MFYLPHEWRQVVTAAFVLAIAVVLAILFGGCGGGALRQSCYARAEASAWSDAEAACFNAHVQWDDCAERQRILDELRDAYGACP